MKKEELIRKVQALREQVDELAFMLTVLQPEPKPEPAPAEGHKDEYLTPRRAQEFLGIKQSTFYEWIRAGILPKGVLFGPKSPRWKRSDIEKAAQRR